MNFEEPENRLSNTIILCGAGISKDAPTKIPLAMELMSDAYLSCFEKIENIEKSTVDISIIKQSLKPVLEKLRFEQFFHIFKKHIDPSLKNIIDLMDIKIPNKNHYLLANLIHKDLTVWTTNFDCNIEIAYLEKFRKKLPVMIDRNYKIKEKKYRKLHGTFGSGESNNFSATMDEIIKDNYFTNKNSIKYKERLEEIKNKKLVVIGYSGNDDFDIIPMLNNSFPSEITWVNHYINDEYNKTQEKIIKKKLYNKKITFINENTYEYLLEKYKFSSKELVFKVEDKKQIAIGKIDNIFIYRFFTELLYEAKLVKEVFDLWDTIYINEISLDMHVGLIISKCHSLTGNNMNNIVFFNKYYSLNKNYNLVYNELLYFYASSLLICGMSLEYKRIYKYLKDSNISYDYLKLLRLHENYDYKWSIRYINLLLGDGRYMDFLVFMDNSMIFSKKNKSIEEFVEPSIEIVKLLNIPHMYLRLLRSKFVYFNNDIIYPTIESKNLFSCFLNYKITYLNTNSYLFVLDHIVLSKKLSDKIICKTYNKIVTAIEEKILTSNQCSSYIVNLINIKNKKSKNIKESIGLLEKYESSISNKFEIEKIKNYIVYLSLISSCSRLEEKNILTVSKKIIEAGHISDFRRITDIVSRSTSDARLINLNLTIKRELEFNEYLIKSEELKIKGDYTSAINILKTKCKKDIHYYEELSDNHLSLQNFNEAYTYAKKAIDINKNSYIANYAIGFCMSVNGKFFDAAPYFEKALTSSIYNPEISRCYINSLFRSKQFEKSINYIMVIEKFIKYQEVNDSLWCRDIETFILLSTDNNIIESFYKCLHIDLFGTFKKNEFFKDYLFYIMWNNENE